MRMPHVLLSGTRTGAAAAGTHRTASTRYNAECVRDRVQRQLTHARACVAGELAWAARPGSPLHACAPCE